MAATARPFAIQAVLVGLLVVWNQSADAFTIVGSSRQRHRVQHSLSTTDASEQEPITVVGVVAPLEYRAPLPYPFLSLRFPNQDNSDENVLTFVVDTGANVNSVPESFSREHKLPTIELPTNNHPIVTAGVGGNLTSPASTIVKLGDCQLNGLPEPQRSGSLLLRNLTAASMPTNALPLLGMPFVLSFPGGVEFDWYGTDGDPPTLIFYYSPTLPDMAKTQDMTSVPLRLVAPELQLLAVSLAIPNNDTNKMVHIPALLDTGSPVTVLNQAAAELAGITVLPVEENIMINKQSSGILGKLLDNKQDTKKKVSSYGDPTIVVGGIDGHPVYLQRSQSTNISIFLSNISAEDSNHNIVSLRQGPVYVGRLPGLAILESALANATSGSASSPPVALLGLDFLQRTYRMIVRPHQQELWVEPLTDERRKLLRQQLPKE